MSRGSEYKFVNTDSSEIVKRIIASYESITEHTVQPADPERLFISWLADIIIKTCVEQNYTGNQNIPSRAEGDNLDALGEWIYSLKRKAAQAAKCTVRFNISEAQITAIPIPAGTRVSDLSQNLVWATTEDALIPIGETYADVMVQCETTGTIGNGYTPGQIRKLIDIDNILYFQSCENITESDGGAEKEDDETYFDMMRSVLDSYSTAGAEGSYIYWAKSVSDEISDVRPVRPVMTRSEECTVYTDGDGVQYAFLGGDQININTLIVRPHGVQTDAEPEADYTAEYENGLLKITIVPDGMLDGETSVDVSAVQDRAGYVYIYALMDDGTIATETIKTAIAEACNQSFVRPLTDYVSVRDPEYVDYNITFTYYIPNDTQLSLSDIEAAVANAVNEYKKWQCGKLGRDINPSKLENLLMQTGVKRVAITSPTFTQLRGGKDNDVPQIARVVTITATNGGYEDE